MGIALYYGFQPSDFNPAENPEEARRRIDQATAMVGETLERFGIPYTLTDQSDSDLKFHRFVKPGGPGAKADPMRIGWCNLDGWENFGGVKTNYAENFHWIHMAYAHALLKLHEAGMVEYIGDDAGYIPDLDTENLLYSKTMSDDSLDAIRQHLVKAGVAYDTFTPTGPLAFTPIGPHESDRLQALQALASLADDPAPHPSFT